MSRISRDVIDPDGTIRSGFDYKLQVWVDEYICDTVGAGAAQYAGKDIRTIEERERRKER